jgi:hypothetical protein
VERRLLAISGRGIEAGRDGEEIVVAWGAKVASAGAGGAEYEWLYRAVRVELDRGSQSASGVCLKTSAEAELDLRGALAAPSCPGVGIRGRSRTLRGGRHSGPSRSWPSHRARVPAAQPAIA